MALASHLLPWYDRHSRQLPWRTDPQPYRVWVSEIMLQQTRVDTAMPYFERWLERFPNIAALAQADQQDVLVMWEGLGYYSRARNLHRAARTVMSEFGGELPAEVSELKKLPGIGPYTAGAIASIAFGKPEALVDGNVRRVLSRYFDLDFPVDTPAGKRRIWALAQENVPADRPGDYNQALMELGALVCRPKSPDCGACPLADGCLARRNGAQELRPVLAPRKGTPHYVVTAGVVRENGLVLIAQRPEDGLLGGMWEFPGGKIEPNEDLESCLRREFHEELGVNLVVNEKLGVFRHAYTHFSVTLHAFEARLDPSGQVVKPLAVADFRWVAPDSLTEYPMGKIDRQIASQISKGLDD